MKTMLKLIILAAIILAATSAGQAGLDDGLVAHWVMNEGRGTIVSDRSPNADTAYLRNGPIWAGGNGVWAVGLDGSDDSLSPEKPVSAFLSGTRQNISLSAFVYARESRLQQIFFSRRGSNDIGGCSFYIGADNLARFESRGDIQVAAVSIQPIAIGQWNFLAVTVEDTGAQWLVQFYLNGQLVHSAFSTGTLYTANETASIGARNVYGIVSGEVTDRFFYGFLKDIRLYQRALTAAEVAQIYDQDRLLLPAIDSSLAASLTYPRNGDTVNGAITLTASVSGNVAGVQFYADGIPYAAEDTAAPYAIDWDSALAPDGIHTITAVARSTSGLTIPSLSVPITTANYLAAASGEITAYSTIQSIGIEWNITGDSNHNATCSAQYRREGAQEWKQALPLFRVDANLAYYPSPGAHSDRPYNMLAGSIFFLDAGATYEVVLSLHDPDGGSAQRSVTVNTRPYPALPAHGRTFHVTAGSGGGSGTPEDPFRGIAAAQAVAQPGDIFLLHAGDYGALLEFTSSGAAGNYIAWRPAGDGEVTAADGTIRVGASHIWIEGIKAVALRTTVAAEDVVLAKNSFVGDEDYAVLLSGSSSNWTIMDNEIAGDKVLSPTKYETQGEGIELNYTSGHVIAYNRIHNAGDGISYPRRNVDIYGNDIYETTDDCLEFDWGYSNVRVWGNRMYNSKNSILSFQPLYAGPVYVIRNQLVASFRDILKMVVIDQFLMVHNTIVGYSRGGNNSGSIGGVADWLLNTFSRNNLWISADGTNPIWLYGGKIKRNWRTNLDYDGFDPAIPGWILSIGEESHAIAVNRNALFERFDVSPISEVLSPAPLLSLRQGANAIDAGGAIVNLNDPYVSDGKPDLGAFEYGRLPPHYGPRQAEDVSGDTSGNGSITAYDASLALQQGRGTLEAAGIAERAVGLI